MNLIYETRTDPFSLKTIREIMKQITKHTPKVGKRTQRQVGKFAWYFVKLAFLAIPLKSKNKKNPRGTLFKNYYLIQAKNIMSAFKKASHILLTSEHCEGDGYLEGKRVIFKKVGILNLTPLYERLQSGVELFDESESDVRYSEITNQIITNRERFRMIRAEKKFGRPHLLDVYWGGDFDKD